MIDTLLVSLAVAAGVAGLAGVPLRLWQFATGRLISRIPRHALAQATFRFFAFLTLTPNALAWAYALYALYRDLACNGPCPQRWVGSAIAVGFLGCAYACWKAFCSRPAAASSRTG